MEKPSVTVIVLNWNGKDLTIECLESLKQVNYSNFNILVVDNDSTDGSVELLKEKFPEGPWCKKGDWIIFARYAGSRIKIDGGEIRLLNDDEVLATVERPEDIFHEF